MAGPLAEAKIDNVYACGPLMQALYDDLPNEVRAGYADGSQALLEQLTSEVRDGDVVMIKGSLGSRMGLIVEGLLALHSEKDAPIGAGD